MADKLRVEEFYDYLRERESIRLKRLAGLPFPWTDDPILQQYKFTNVKRAHDRTSAALITEFYQQPDNFHAPMRVLLLNCGIARYFGTIDFMRAVGWQKTFKPNRLIRVAMKRLADRLPVFTGAYIITSGNTAGPKPITVVEQYLTALWGHGPAIVKIAKAEGRWQPVIEYMMKNVRGFGGTGFCAKEVMLDTFHTSFWAPNAEPLDRDTWTAIGPGTMRGAARALGREKSDDKRKMTKATPDESRDVIKTLFDSRKKYWPSKYVKLNLDDIAFQLCEFDKMTRVKLGQGRPRSRFIPPSQRNTAT